MVPAKAIVNVSADVPLLSSVNACAVVCEPTGWLPKAMEAGVRLTAGATPVTDREATKGLPEALDATLTVPLAIPVADGEAVTLTMQLAPGPREAGQLFDWANGSAVVTPEMVAAVPPVFVTVIPDGAEVAPTITFPKLTVVGLRAMLAGGLPVPVNAAVFGDVLAFEATERFADNAPAVCGFKNAVIVQFAAAARVAGQLFDCENEVGFAPVILTAIPVRSMFPVFVRVNVWQVCEVKTCCDPHAALVGASVAIGAPPVPLRGTAWGDPAAFVSCETVATFAPAVIGQSLILTRQDCPGLRVLGWVHVPVPPNKNSAALAPRIWVAVFKVRGELPVLVIVKV